MTSTQGARTGVDLVTVSALQPSWPTLAGRAVGSVASSLLITRSVVFLLTLLRIYPQETQEKDGKSYTDFTTDNFECGRYKLLSEINRNDGESVEEEQDSKNDGDYDNPANASDDELELFTLMEEEDKDIHCGSTIVNDRWMISSARCFDKFLIPGDGVSYAR